MAVRLWTGRAVAAFGTLLLLLGVSLETAAEPTPSAAAAPDTPAPALASPAANLTLSTMAFDLAWHGVVGATQYHVQVTPFNNDGPGINVIRGSETNLALSLPDPVFGPFLLLPDMTYRWRVRASTKTEFADEGDGSWGGWSEERPFRTPRLSELGMRVIDPLDGAQLSPGPVRFRWSHSDPAIFYWEVQVSKEPSFDTNPASGPSFVWWNLIHGGVSNPRNSWLSPELPAGFYYWRVRPRVQGDGRPGVWSATTRFQVSGPASSPTPAAGTPTATPVPGASPTPTAVAVGAYITFESNRNGNFEVYTQRVDSTTPRSLTQNPANERQPRWSPDGARLAFVSDREGSARLYVMNADGSGLKGGELAESFAWSPDSSRLAVADPTGGVRIYYPSFGLYKELAAGGVFTGFAGMSWGPDSQRLAVSARSFSEPRHQIYLYTWKNGVVASNITQGLGDNREPTYQTGMFRLTFVSNRGGSWDIWDGNDRAEGLLNLTQVGEGAESQISWAPKGGRLLFVRGAGASADIWSMNADGTNPVNLTNSPGEDVDPVWSPDAGRILFTSSRNGNPEVYLMNADGSNPINLSLSAGIDRSASWNPK